MPYILHPDGFVAVLCPLCGAVTPDERDSPQAFLDGYAIGPVCFDHAGTHVPAGWFIIEEEVEAS